VPAGVLGQPVLEEQASLVGQEEDRYQEGQASLVGQEEEQASLVGQEEEQASLVGLEEDREERASLVDQEERASQEHLRQQQEPHRGVGTQASHHSWLGETWAGDQFSS